MLHSDTHKGLNSVPVEFSNANERERRKPVQIKGSPIKLYMFLSCSVVSIFVECAN
jgi:hypothetical protein